MHHSSYIYGKGLACILFMEGFQGCKVLWPYYFLLRQDTAIVILNSQSSQWPYVYMMMLALRLAWSVTTNIPAMTVSTAYLSWMVVLICVVLAPTFVHSQIPTACADAESLRTLTCCPNECGEADGRGVCEDIDLPDHYSRTSSDVRANWPHYFTRACSCTGNYWGYDCSRCKYGYYGEDCSQ